MTDLELEAAKLPLLQERLRIWLLIQREGRRLLELEAFGSPRTDRIVDLIQVAERECLAASSALERARRIRAARDASGSS